VPSALILPLAGFLVGQGRLSSFAMLLAATTGSMSSALVFYVLGRRIGEERLREFVGRFGRYVLRVEETDGARVARLNVRSEGRRPTMPSSRWKLSGGRSWSESSGETTSPLLGISP
jgi:hypothetical protein